MYCKAVSRFWQPNVRKSGKHFPIPIRFVQNQLPTDRHGLTPGKTPRSIAAFCPKMSFSSDLMLPLKQRKEFYHAI